MATMRASTVMALTSWALTIMLTLQVEPIAQEVIMKVMVAL